MNTHHDYFAFDSIVALDIAALKQMRTGIPCREPTYLVLDPAELKCSLLTVPTNSCLCTPSPDCNQATASLHHGVSLLKIAVTADLTAAQPWAACIHSKCNQTLMLSFDTE